MNFQKHIEEYFGPISLEEASILGELFLEKDLPKGDFLVKENSYCKDLAFVTDGVVRVYKNQNGKEITQWLAGPNSFVTEISSFLFNQESRWNIQAIENTKLYSISKTDYRELVTQIPRWPEMEKMFLAKCFAVLESRVFSHLALNSEERYLHFSSIYPELITKVPLQYLASLLGMSPETLSRVRKKQSTS